MKPIRLLYLGLCFFYVPLKAQNSYQYGLFPTIDHTGTISKRFDYSLYYFGGFNLINRDENRVKQPANLFVCYAEQALTYKASSKLSFSGSYVFERQFPSKINYRNENRFYLQSTYLQQLNKETIKHRLRFDGRFIQNRSTGKSPFTSRIRYLIGINSPISKSNDKLYFSAYNEFFFNTYKDAATIYGENWAYAGIGYKSKHAGNFEVGPLYIFWVKNSRFDLDNFLYLQLTWATQLNWMKKQSN